MASLHQREKWSMHLICSVHFPLENYARENVLMLRDLWLKRLFPEPQDFHQCPTVGTKCLFPFALLQILFLPLVLLFRTCSVTRLSGAGLPATLAARYFLMPHLDGHSPSLKPSVLFLTLILCQLFVFTRTSSPWAAGILPTWAILGPSSQPQHPGTWSASYRGMTRGGSDLLHTMWVYVRAPSFPRRSASSVCNKILDRLSKVPELWQQVGQMLLGTEDPVWSSYLQCDMYFTEVPGQPRSCHSSSRPASRWTRTPGQACWRKAWLWRVGMVWEQLQVTRSRSGNCS